MVSLYGELARHVLASAFDRLRGSSTMRRLSHLERSQWWDRERIEAQQQVHLRELIAHSYAHVPYYRRVMDDRGLRPDDIRTTEDLRRLPILTRAAIRANFREMLSDAVPPGVLQYQLVQEDVTHRRLRFVPCEEMDSNGLSALSRRMTALLSMSLGEPMQVTIEPVNHIEMNLSGKRLSFVSRLAQAGDAGVDAGIVGAWTTTGAL